MESSFWAKFSEYGLVGLVVAVLFFILWQIICWAKTFISAQAKQYFDAVTAMTTQHNTERLTWLETLTSLNRSIELHNQNSLEARKATEDAHRYQKDEHEKLATSMNNMCISIVKVNDSLQETEKALGRINGYK